MSGDGNTVSRQNVILSSHRGRESKGVARILTLCPLNRKKRALRALIASWGLAIASVFIPLAHFLLVPLFLILGPVLARWLHSAERLLIGIDGNCPECGRSFEVSRTPLRWPLNDVCGNCHESVVLKPESGSE